MITFRMFRKLKVPRGRGSWCWPKGVQTQLWGRERFTVGPAMFVNSHLIFLRLAFSILLRLKSELLASPHWPLALITD